MQAHPSLYALFGLRPGASRADIDNAYRRLIKQYHPDRPGGDADRAADLNRAYAVLKHSGDQRLPVRRASRRAAVHAPPFIKNPPRYAKPLLAVAAGAISGIVLLTAWQNQTKPPGPTAEPFVRQGMAAARAGER